jgi:hypothetical protein
MTVEQILQETLIGKTIEVVRIKYNRNYDDITKGRMEVFKLPKGSILTLPPHASAHNIVRTTMTVTIKNVLVWFDYKFNMEQIDIYFDVEGLEKMLEVDTNVDIKTL